MTVPRVGRYFLDQRLRDLNEEIMTWISGERSHWKDILTVLPDPERRAEALALCAQADAAEVMKLSAAIQAVVALGGKLP